MGAYLSQPIVEKVSNNEANDFIRVGVSSMQGWRISQEDAHNSILDFDEKNPSSFFAVYDGHGGAEVATYCSDKFPEFIKALKSYKDGNFEQALKDSFLDFDATLLNEDVIRILKRLADEKNPENDSELAEEEDEEDLMELCQEGSLPIEEVLQKYKEQIPKLAPHLNKLKQSEPSGSGSSSSSKPMSPFLRGRRAAASSSGAGPSSSSCSSTSSAVGASASCISSVDEIVKKPETEDDSLVSSSSAKSLSDTAGEGKSIIEPDRSNEASSSDPPAKTPTTANGKKSLVGKSSECNTIPDSSSLIINSPSSTKLNRIKDSAESSSIVRNGNLDYDSSHQENEISTNSKPESVKSEAADVSSSSAELSAIKAVKENGEVSASPSSSTTAPDQAHSSTQSTEAKASADDAEVGTGGGSSLSLITSSSKELKLKKREAGGPASGGKAMYEDDDDSSSDDDADFHADEDSSSTEDCETYEDESDEDEDNDEENEDTEDEDEDEDMLDDEDEETAAFRSNMIEEPGKDSGCTAVVALLDGRDLYVANAGDSRCVVCRNGKAIEMSIDHKPEDEVESDRITKAGGKVTQDGRVNGGLNLSRAIGDHAYKMNKDLPREKQMISALPDIRKLIITPEDEFMILACDGIWNFMSSEQVVDFVKTRLTEGKTKLSEICEELFDHCLAPNTFGDGTGCDNMTAVIVQFTKRFQELSTKIPPESITVETVSTAAAKKRSASDDADDLITVENLTKRQKTGNEKTDVDSNESLATEITTKIQPTSTSQMVSMPSIADDR